MAPHSRLRSCIAHVCVTLCLSILLAAIADSPLPAALAAGDGMWIIDVHNHLQALGPGNPPGKAGRAGRQGRRGTQAVDLSGAAATALEHMNRHGVRCILIMPPPLPDATHPGMVTAADLARVVRAHPGRFAFLAGGESLNPIIQEAVQAGRVTADMEARFDRAARAVLDAGAVGFGELGAEHLCLGPTHHHHAAPPDHPLFLRLADIAAAAKVPIDLHMEAVVEDMPLPSRLPRDCNPSRLPANIAALERLLRHNRGAAIIWDHVGWDNTGDRTAALTAQLLERNANLYMSFKICPRDSLAASSPMAKDRRSITAEWLAVIRRFPERLMIGADRFFLPQGSQRSIGPDSWEPTMNFFTLLPADVARTMGHDTPLRLFKRLNQ